MIIKLTKKHKTADGRVFQAGRIIETSKGHEYKDFEVLAEDGHFGSPQNAELKAKIESMKTAKNASPKTSTAKPPTNKRASTVKKSPTRSKSAKKETVTQIKEENNGSK